ncbi:MAG: DUF4390 domain-containing protein [Betaproteobacteria bacterium]|nr:DUF4390 domain-containing protein [Betaproteobacteria bacterium]
MGSITRSWKSASAGSCLAGKARALVAAGLWLLAIHASAARADGITVRSADLTLVDAVYRLDADFDIHFSPSLKSALSKGVPLVFEIDFDVTRPHSYWFSREVAHVSQTVRLSYDALTRQYEVSVDGVHKNFASFEAARDDLARVRDWQVLDRSRLERNTAYQAGLRLFLDVSSLPKPLQINALASDDWNLDSGWFVWPLSP